MIDPTASVRYLVDDVQAAVGFYTEQLGFELSMNAAPALAVVERGHLRLVLNGPSGSAAVALTDGRQPAGGGWNRIQLVVLDLEDEIERLRAAGVSFRGELIVGRGGWQILIDDPSGNPVELFQPTTQRRVRC